MSEIPSNALNDFLNSEETSENSLFSDFPFPEPTDAPVAPIPDEEPRQAVEAPPVNAEEAQEPQTKPTAQGSLFAEALAQTPAAANASQIEKPEDTFAAAFAKAKAKSDERLSESFSSKDAIFQYGKAKDPISDRDCTFEDLRIKYEDDFPELSESKKVSWTVSYGKVTKSISNPGSDKVYEVKAEIEKSKTFLDGIKKAKSDADKNPECFVKPRVIAQSKGEFRIPAYKDYCCSIEEARRSEKPIVILPSRNGKIYEMRTTPVGTFTAPAVKLPEFPVVESGFQMALPKIPLHILMVVLNFFRKLSEEYELEALVHILYDTQNGKYTIRVPKQELTHTSVHSVLEEEYPEHLIHVMDIHSHNTMPAVFSTVDDEDEKATRLYTVVGMLHQVFPEITVRACCAGQFIPIRPEDVFETGIKAYPYPRSWNNQIVANRELPLCKGYETFYYVRLSRDDELEGESYSISNQKKLLTKVAKDKGYTHIEVFCDDGISGVTMNRPEFTKMIEQLEMGKAAAVFVKDLSRLGRNYIEVGRLTEEFFPEHNVRLISVSDNLDTDEGESELTPIKNLFNEWYARDISKKRRISNKIKGGSGIPLSPPPYGYMKDPNDPHHWIIDEEAAYVVRRIFDMSMEGLGTFQIALALDADRVLTPSEYAVKKGIKKAGGPAGKTHPDPCHWGQSTISKILSTQEYCGDVINFKTYSVSYKSKTRHANDPENILVFKDVHEPIIDRTVFETVQLRRGKTRKRTMSNGEKICFQACLCVRIAAEICTIMKTIRTFAFSVAPVTIKENERSAFQHIM